MAAGESEAKQEALAISLARAVVAALRFRLALEVLAGGVEAHANALELAQEVLCLAAAGEGAAREE
ncbi:MAG: hypothetical protein SFV15_22690 [Polyangiaceae bacterium]|nr:hypothetical protein [Polyangiaceae bacterium]